MKFLTTFAAAASALRLKTEENKATILSIKTSALLDASNDPFAAYTASLGEMKADYSAEANTCFRLKNEGVKGAVFKLDGEHEIKKVRLRKSDNAYWGFMNAIVMAGKTVCGQAAGWGTFDKWNVIECPEVLRPTK